VSLADQPIHRQAADFLFVPKDQVVSVAEREGAIPYDIPGVELVIMASAARSTRFWKNTSSTTLRSVPSH